MNKRREALRAMMAPVAPPPADERPHRSAAPSGSLKAMGLTLKSLADEADEARALRTRLAEGAEVVELDSASIDPSFVRDRLGPLDGAEFEAFKASLAQDGQQVPILVRPSPDADGRYQAAYGHRRLAALQALGRPVRAIVRVLTDEQLIIAQGKENSDRRDLSFIERALFAARLEDRGFSRNALISALSLQKGNLSTMISVARALPEDLVLAIGAAPKVGRPRWEQFARLVDEKGSLWREALADPTFAPADSDQRFEIVFRRLAERRAAPRALEAIHTRSGERLAAVERGKGRVRLTVEARHAAGFGAWLVEQLPEIHAAFLRRPDA